MQIEEKELQQVLGTTVQDINKFITSYEATQKMMKKIKDPRAMQDLAKQFKLK